MFEDWKYSEIFINKNSYSKVKQLQENTYETYETKFINCSCNKNIHLWNKMNYKE